MIKKTFTYSTETMEMLIEAKAKSVDSFNAEKLSYKILDPETHEKMDVDLTAAEIQDLFEAIIDELNNVQDEMDLDYAF